MTREKPPAICHPDRPSLARLLCASCYQMAWRGGALAAHPSVYMHRVDFVRDYETLRADGLLRIEIAGRLGMTRSAVDAAYVRAVRVGALTPDSPDMRARACERARLKALEAMESR